MKSPLPRFPPAKKVRPMQMPPINLSVVQRNAWLSAEVQRSALETATVEFQRMEILRKHFGVKSGNWLELAFHLARELPGFRVEAGKAAGRKKKSQRFAVVTSIEDLRARKGVGVKAAARALSNSAKFREMSTEASIEAAYYKYKREIEKNPTSRAYIELWRGTPLAVRASAKAEFETLFAFHEGEASD